MKPGFWIELLNISSILLLWHKYSAHCFLRVLNERNVMLHVLGLNLKIASTDSVGGSYLLISHVVHVDFAQFSWKQTCFAPKWPQLQSLFPCLLIPVGWSKAYFLKFHPAILLPPSRGQSELWTSLHGLHTCPAWDCNDLLSDFSPGQCIWHSVQGGFSLREVRCGYFDLEGTWRNVFNLFLILLKRKI